MKTKLGILRIKLNWFEAAKYQFHSAAAKPLKENQKCGFRTRMGFMLDYISLDSLLLRRN